MTAPAKLAHVVFRTNNLAAMRDWYCATLAAHVVFENDRLAFLTYDDEHHRVALIATGPLAPRPSTPTIGFYHVAFTYDRLVELLDNYDRLKAIDIVPWRTINHGATMSFYYADPDGNDVELQVDRFPDIESAQDWILGEAFTKNPIGTLVEPGDLRRRLDAGESIESVMRRSDEVAAL